MRVGQWMVSKPNLERPLKRCHMVGLSGRSDHMESKVNLPLGFKIGLEEGVKG